MRMRPLSDKVKYLGQIIDKMDGNWINPEQLRENKIFTLNIVTMLQAFWILADYFQIYIPNICNVIAPLNDLLKRNVKWCWIDKCEKVFHELKHILTPTLLLTHFYSKLDIILVYVYKRLRFRSCASSQIWR